MSVRIEKWEVDYPIKPPKLERVCDIRHALLKVARAVKRAEKVSKKEVVR